jgi:hypothetical protein
MSYKIEKTKLMTTQPPELSKYYKIKADIEDSKVCWYCNEELDLDDERIPSPYFNEQDKRIPPHKKSGWCKQCNKVMATREYYFSMTY